MKKFTIESNSYLEKDIKGYFGCDYIGYQKAKNPDYINHLKNMSNQKGELDLIEDFIEATEKITEDFNKIIDNEQMNFTVCVIPRSKAEKHYKQSQLMFRKVISCVADNLKMDNQTNAIKRVKDTKTTHNWRLENNTGDSPYKGITKDTCTIDEAKIENKNILLVDDIYTHGVYIAEDCIQLLLDLGAKSVILYVAAKTRD